MLDHAANPGRHSLADRGRDLYETPPEATRALLRVEQIPHGVWEPAAGRGAIVRLLRDAGHAVIASDIQDYDFPLHFVRNFLTTTEVPAGTEIILTNPPYQLAAEFVAHALQLCPRVVMLCRLAFFESERRSAILDRGQLARIHVFSDRLPMMHRDGWAGRKATNSIAFAWFVWDRNHDGLTTIDRISWKATRSTATPRETSSLTASSEKTGEEPTVNVHSPAPVQPTTTPALVLVQPAATPVQPATPVLVQPATTPAHTLYRDYETRSRIDLTKAGAWKYAAHPRTEVLCCAYAVDEDPPQIWVPGNPIPAPFIEAARDPAWLIVAHGAQFERAIEELLLHPRFDWPLVPIERQRCTMAAALSHSLPASLSGAAEALSLLHQKDKAGQRLMLLMSKPRRPHKDEDPNGIYWFDDPDRLNRLYNYARADTEVERELYQRLRPLSANEQTVWQLDARINARGFYVDRELALAARKIAQAAAPEIDAEITEITGGTVTTINQLARLLAWLTTQGCTPNKLDKKAIEKLLLRDDLSAPVRRALELRRDGLRRRPRRSPPCSTAPAKTDAPAACCAITAPAPVAGRATASSRRI
jgi:DNA polymerase